MDIVALGPGDYDEATRVWEASVRATHDFLDEGFVERVRPRLAAEFLPAVDLFGVRAPAGRLLAILGVAGARVEMLFVAPGDRGRGLGRRLLDFAVTARCATELDVNEQNVQALGFYLHLGFTVYGRSPLDAQGLPYPVLHLRLT